MRLHRIELNKFRSFNNIMLDFNGDSIVIFGENGVGKSSILHAINLLFIRILYSIIQEKSRPIISMQTSDIKNGYEDCRIAADFEIDGERHSFTRSIKKMDIVNIIEKN